MSQIKIPNSLRGRLFYTFILSIIITTFSFGLSLMNSMKLQNIADKRFSDEQFFISIESVLADLQAPLEAYLSVFSTSSLAELMSGAEVLHNLIPNERPIYASELELLKREIYFLIDKYLISIEEVILEKRGRKVEEYSKGYEELLILYTYIVDRIDTLSLKGFRSQLEEYNHFLVLFRKLQLYSLILILLVVTTAFSFLMSNINSISGPLSQLSIMAGRISNGDFDFENLSFKSVNEINRVSAAFNKMKNSIRHYIDELNRQKSLEKEIMTQRVHNLKMEQVLKRMELYTMQAQMNPHFLFNTINTGVQLAIVEEAEKTASFMENLAALFRYNIREKRFFVPLRKEYEGMISYINILKIRFPSSLNIILDVDNDILDSYNCPAMVLQPIVENAVLHAFTEKEGIGTIIISIFYKNGILTISVEDNGKGIPGDIINELLIPHTHEYKLSSKVMGLENVIQRCYFFYPNDRDIIKINSILGKSTNITINIDTEVEPCIEL